MLSSSRSALLLITSPIWPCGKPNSSACLSQPGNGEAATVSNGATLGLAASSDEAVSKWHAAGLAAGGTCDGPPGPRERAPNNSVGAYLRDPDGNKICAFNMRH